MSILTELHEDMAEVRTLAEECVSKMIREELHGVALTCVEFPDGWTLEDLAHDNVMMANMMDMIANEEV